MKIPMFNLNFSREYYSENLSVSIQFNEQFISHEHLKWKNTYPPNHSARLNLKTLYLINYIDIVIKIFSI